jgi:Fe-S cluster assembly iron-binding protein IscA
LGLALDEPNENEDTTQVNGIDVLISDAVKAFADRNTIDYVNSPYGEGFIIAPAGHIYC